MMRLPCFALVCSASLLAPPGCAAVVYDAPAATGPILSPGSVSVDFTGRKGGGQAAFRLRGYASLDGANNGYTDIFTLSHNGIDLYSGSFDLGGGGQNVQFFGPVGSSFTVSSPGMWQGGIADIAVPLTLTDGTNSLRFRYSGNAQGGWDEAWGLDRLTITAGTGAVPEPASWAMLITGFGFIGAALRSRRKARHAVSARPLWLNRPSRARNRDRRRDLRPSLPSP